MAKKQVSTKIKAPSLPPVKITDGVRVAGRFLIAHYASNGLKKQLAALPKAGRGKAAASLLIAQLDLGIQPTTPAGIVDAKIEAIVRSLTRYAVEVCSGEIKDSCSVQGVRDDLANLLTGQGSRIADAGFALDRCMDFTLGL